MVKIVNESMYRLEVCVDSVQSAVNAASGGASRLELCSNLTEGGTTPSLGMLKTVKKAVSIPVYAMVRPRGGDFLYSDTELQVMKEDIRLLKENGVDGIVFGVLTANGDIDLEKTKELLQLSRPLPVTFHRAFDMARDLDSSLDVLVDLGIERVLTSGGDSTALEGLPVLERLVRRGGNKILVVPGGGITERNLDRILMGCGATEFHCSARCSVASAMDFRRTNVGMGASFGPPEYCVKVADQNRVTALLAVCGSLGEKKT